MDGSWVNNIPVRYIYWVAGVMATVLSGLCGVVGTMAVKAVQKDRRTIKGDLAEMKQELAIQRSNHLSHIQKAVEEQGLKQDQTNLELAKQTGVLETIADLLKK